MRSLPCAILSVVLFAPFRTIALDVSVYNPILSHCGYPTGVLQALVSGGVPPYSIAWNTGATTEIITGLPPGTYGVTVTDFEGTQAVAQGDVNTVSLLQGGQTFADLAHCTGAYPMVDLTLRNEGQWGVPIYGQPPFTITGPPEVVSVTLVPCEFCMGLDSLTRVEADVPSGSIQTITWEDANGCPGESTVIMSTEVIWPTVQVYGVQGACSNGANGSFSFTASSAQRLTLRVLDPQGDLISSFAVDQSGPVTGMLGTLDPGVYQVVALTEVNGDFGDELCGDTTLVTIEDLGTTCGNVNGPVFIDGNANCAWNGGENRLPQAIVEFTPGPYYATTNGSGNYSANLPLGTYDHTVIHPGAQQECPGPFTLSAGQGLVAEPIGCSSLLPLDVEVSMANGPARPGFDLVCAIVLQNNTAANTGASTLTLVHDPTLDFVSASPTPSSVTGNTITWNLTGLGAYLTRNHHVTFSVPPDVGLIGTTLNSTATVGTTNTDAFPPNNVWISTQEITGSFDPNSKEAHTSTRLSEVLYFIDQDEWIDYTLHFQNTGTDTAFLVVVTDTLPSTLDPASVDVGAASHAFNWGLSGTGVLTFNFPNILLPDSNVNEAASHGFVHFRIRPGSPLLPGTIIANTANIFFDLNEPVITAPSTLIAEFSTGTEEPVHEGVQAYPDPADERITVRAGQPIMSLWLMAADGRILQEHRPGARTMDLHLNGIAPGMYLMRLRSEDGTIVTRTFIKR